MRLFKYLIPLLTVLQFGGSSVFATLAQDGTRFLEELNERDTEVLVDYLNTKRLINLTEKADKLHISGRVNFEWRHLTESERGENLRGNGAVDPSSHLPISRNDFDVEFNIDFDYDNDRDWAVASLKFDNSAGVDDNQVPCRIDPEGFHGGGRCNSICLKKAFMGYTLFECEDKSFLDLEIGRKGNLYNAFESEIEFLSRFDGILLTYENEFKNFSKYYWRWAGFVVDERVNHFAWATEFCLKNIKDSGLEVKYNFIDWPKHGKNFCFVHNPEGFRFRVSQILFTYRFLAPKCLWEKKSEVYGAFLCNHDAHKTHITRKHAGLGWYYGFTIGEVKKEGDWAFDAHCEVVQAKAIPDNDVGGIGRGNVLNQSFTQDGEGNTNYIGWKFESLYAITDQLNLQAIIEFSRQYDQHIGGRHHYSKFELEAVYAF